MTPSTEHRLCLVCNEAITDPLAVRLNHKIHDSCLNCEFCHKAVSIEVVLRCINDGIPPSHAPCRDRYRREEFEKQPVTISQKLLTHMNHALSMFQPNMELSIDTNKVVAVNASRGFFHEKGLDEQLYALRMLEAIAAELHTIIAKNPKHLQIMLDARDLDRIESAKQYRDQQHVKKQEKHAKAVQQYESRKRLSPEERRHENAVIALMDGAGLTREQAEKHIAEAKAKKIG